MNDVFPIATLHAQSVIRCGLGKHFRYNAKVKRKIITNKLEVKKISGEWNIIIYDKIKTNKEIYNKKIKDIFGKGILNGIRE